MNIIYNNGDGNVKYCKKCGNKLSENAEFCKHCGSQIKHNSNTRSYNARSAVVKSNKKLIVAVICIIIVLLALSSLFIYLFFFRTESFDESNIGEIYYSQIDPEHIAVSADKVTKYADNEVLVVAKSDVSKSDIEDLAKSFDAEIVGYIEQTGDYQLKFNNVKTEDELNGVIKQIKNNENISDASMNYISDTVTEAYNVGNRWNTNTTGGTQLNRGTALKNAKDPNSSYNEWWGLDRINAPAAWAFMDKNDPIPVKVGLIDSGFNESHSDLSFSINGVFYQNGKNDTNLFSDWNGETVTVDGNQVDKLYQYTHHGSHVAGIMAANGQNENGIIGVYPYGNNNSLYGVSLWGASGMYSSLGSPTRLNVSDIEYKVALAELILRNVKVINFSMGWGAKNQYNTDGSVKKIEGRTKSIATISAYLSRFLENGFDFVIVCSAGNDSNDDQNLINIVGHLESEYNSVFSGITNKEIKDRIIVVGSIDDNNEISDFSDAGNRVDIFAPGRDIWSTWSEHDEHGGTISSANQYRNISGTSMASPHVAGVAANVWSMNNKLTGAEVKEIVCGAHLKKEYRIGGIGKAAMIEQNPYSYIDINGIHPKYIVDCNAAVIEAYKRRDEASSRNDKTNSEKGSVLGWVVEQNEDGSAANENNPKVPNAKISVYTNDPKHSLIEETNADESGHYELFLDPGNYVIEASCDGYIEDINYEPVPVKVTNEEVRYVKWIELKSDSKLSAEKCAQIVIDNEALWLDPLNKLKLVDRGSLACWFEDIDFDDSLEFIVGGIRTKNDDEVGYYIFKFKGNKMIKLYEPSVDRDTVSAGTSSTGAIPTKFMDPNPGFSEYNGEIIKDKDGKFKYIFPYSFDDPKNDLGIAELKIEGDNLIWSVIGGYKNGSESKCINSSGEEVTSDELRASLSEWFDGTSMYWPKFGSIPCSYTNEYMDTDWYSKVSSSESGLNDAASSFISACYDVLSKNEKKSALIKSYNMYGIRDNEYSSSLYSSFLDRFEKDFKEKINITDWKDAYISRVKETDNEYFKYYYGFININNDSIPELFYTATQGVGEMGVLTVNENGEVSIIGAGAKTSIEYIEGGNMCKVSSGPSLGTYDVFIYNIENGQFQSIAEGQIVTGETPLRYYWGDKEEVFEVSESNFKKSQEDAFDSSRAKYPQADISYDDIIKAIENY